MMNHKKSKDVGRPKTNDPKIKFESVRLKTSTVIDIEIIAEKLNVTKSTFVQTILENEMPKYKNLLGIKNQIF